MRDATAPRPTAEMIRQAADWAAQLDSDRVTREDRAACDAWCAEHALHRLAFDRMRGFDDRFATLGSAEKAALKRSMPRRHSATKAAGSLLAICAMAGSLWMAAHSFTVRGWFPDYQTAPGEQRDVALVDGSRLLIDTDSKVDFAAGRDARTVSLFDGQVMATVARDTERPFVVETRDGTATALGTVFTVRREADATLVTVIESSVRVCPRRHDDGCATLQAGEQARISGTGIARLGHVGEAASAWTKGWIEADDRPLTEILDELNRYRAQPIRYDADALGRMRVTGSYPLLDTDRALRAIADTMGLDVGRTPEGAPMLTR